MRDSRPLSKLAAALKLRLLRKPPTIREERKLTDFFAGQHSRRAVSSLRLCTETHGNRGAKHQMPYCLFAVLPDGRVWRVFMTGEGRRRSTAAFAVSRLRLCAETHGNWGAKHPMPYCLLPVLPDGRVWRVFMTAEGRTRSTAAFYRGWPAAAVSCPGRR